MAKFNWRAKDDSREEFNVLINGHRLSVQRLMTRKWWWCVYSSTKEMVVSSYTNGIWCEDAESAMKLAEKSYLSLPNLKNEGDMECIHCECEFKLPQGMKRDKLLHSINHDTDQEVYMCEDCYLERANAEHRYVHGIKICASDGCGRDAIEFSDYCEICLQEHNN